MPRDDVVPFLPNFNAGRTGAPPEHASTLPGRLHRYSSKPGRPVMARGKESQLICFRKERMM